MFKNKKINLFNWFKKKSEQKEKNKTLKEVIKKQSGVNKDSNVKFKHIKHVNTFNKVCNSISEKSIMNSFDHSTSTINNSCKNNKLFIANKVVDDLLDVSIKPNLKKVSFFKKLKGRLEKTRINIGLNIKKLFFKKNIDKTIFKSIEDQLLMADLGHSTTTNIIKLLTKEVESKQILDKSSVYLLLKRIMFNILKKVEVPLKIKKSVTFVILVVGSNGVGKTTTIGKLARIFKKEGKTVMLAAGDTFRAGATEQLSLWGAKSMISVISQHPGADSAAVIFDAIKSAKSKKIDVLIADTAGRLQNKLHLMEELKKIIRVMKKIDNLTPHEIILVIDASSGQNIIQQIKLFNKALGITGIVLTKLDGTAKGGVLFTIANKFSIPVRYIGIGEKIDDLSVFNSSEFITAIFSKKDE